MAFKCALSRLRLGLARPHISRRLFSRSQVSRFRIAFFSLHILFSGCRPVWPNFTTFRAPISTWSVFVHVRTWIQISVATFQRIFILEIYDRGVYPYALFRFPRACAISVCGKSEMISNVRYGFDPHTCPFRSGWESCGRVITTSSSPAV